MYSEMILKDLELWLGQKKKDHEHGECMSLAESTHGLNAIKDVIVKIEELKNKSSGPKDKIKTAFFKDGFPVACETESGVILDTKDGIKWTRRSE